MEPIVELRRLLADVPCAGLDDLPQSVMAVAPALGASEIVIYVVDYNQTFLVPLDGPGVPRRRPLRVDGSLGGRAFTAGRTHRRAGRVGRAGRLWVPLVDGCHRLGVVEIATTGSPGQLRDAADELAAVVAQLLISRRAYGDKIERIRRREPMQLAAEIVWSQLPPLSFTASRAMVTGILEPCYDIGGDVFDYALNGDLLSVALFDAVGHGTEASLLATLCLSAYRNARRCGLDLRDTTRSVDKLIHAHRPGSFASAVLAELDCGTGALRMVVAGHPAPLLLRGGRLGRVLPAPTALPLGLGYLSADGPRVVEEMLHPGDQLLLYTDGVIEARSSTGEMFGVDRLVDLVTRALADGLPTPESMRRLVGAILRHQNDQLQDDATALFVEWTPDESGLRRS
ncbi:PP2C family protein-serine/threonine phosphatase [Plantactinospora solaniradicis]|uniref:PP2C family protein-serine/threonine phosphatase n=1 Tax=Plantactinospora solaniradicis TaxID=1723736 RepID=A0ABW1KB55_9ACTN